jgi:para-nitrobenzyl esterase
MNRCAFLATTLAAAAAAVATAQIVETPIPGDPVAIETGKVAGKILPNGTKAWLGIPYAAPPVGDLRWREPRPVKPWKGIYNADRFMPECIQILRPHDINHYFGEEPTSEDFLYLNVWAPAAARLGANLPVIVFIYGGGFTIGSSGMAIYGGEKVAEHNAVFVNFNYRVGAFGFMAHPELTAESPHHQSGNYGFLDQVAALSWIKRNISRFGGDPSKVIVSGQSAGAGSVSVLQASPLAKGLFRGVVPMSGSAWSNGGDVPSLETAERTGLRIQEALKAKSLDRMRQIPADRILALQEAFQAGATGGGPIRVGGAIVDGYFLPDSPARIFAAHKQNDIPVITGFTHDESSNALRTAKNLTEYRATSARLFGPDSEEFLKLYPASTDAEARDMGATAAREGMVEKGARNWAIAQTQNGSAPVYLFLYSRVHPYIKDVHLADQDPATIGAYHTSDVPYWFGTLDSLNMIRPTREWTAVDRGLSQRMMDTLIAFAKNGNPSTDAVRWPRWAPNQEQLVEFDATTAVRAMDTKRLDFMAKHALSNPSRRAARD